MPLEGSILMDVANPERFTDDPDANDAVAEAIASIFRVEANDTLVRLVLERPGPVAGCVRADYSIAERSSPAASANSLEACSDDGAALAALTQQIQGRVNARKRAAAVPVWETFLGFDAAMKDAAAFNKSKLERAAARAAGAGSASAQVVKVQYKVKLEYTLPEARGCRADFQRAIAAANGVLPASVDAQLTPLGTGAAVAVAITQSSPITIDDLKVTTADARSLAGQLLLRGVDVLPTVSKAPSSLLSVILALLSTTSAAIPIPDQASLNAISAAVGAGKAKLFKAWHGHGMEFRRGVEYGLSVVNCTFPAAAAEQAAPPAKPREEQLAQEQVASLLQRDVLSSDREGRSSAFLLLLVFAYTLACAAGALVVLVSCWRKGRAVFGEAREVRHAAAVEVQRVGAADPELNEAYPGGWKGELEQGSTAVEPVRTPGGTSVISL